MLHQRLVPWPVLRGYIKETAQALEVSALGGLLDMKTCPRVGSELELTNLLSGQVAQARIVGTRPSKEGAAPRVAVELLTPSDTFWGLNFQLRKTSAELVKIEQEIQAGGIDDRILREFRDSVDYCAQNGVGRSGMAGARTTKSTIRTRCSR